jgi:hypothetical protein
LGPVGGEVIVDQDGSDESELFIRLLCMNESVGRLQEVEQLLLDLLLEGLVELRVPVLLEHLLVPLVLEKPAQRILHV